MGAMQNGDKTHRPLAIISRAQEVFDGLLPPATRRHAYESTHKFATERPIFFSFIAAHAFFSALPLLAFIAFVLSALTFSLIGLLLSALGFIGFALLFLLPVLFVTSSVALLSWAWFAGAFFLARWVYEHSSIPAAIMHRRAETNGVNPDGHHGEE